MFKDISMLQVIFQVLAESPRGSLIFSDDISHCNVNSPLIKLTY